MFLCYDEDLSEGKLCTEVALRLTEGWEGMAGGGAGANYLIFVPHICKTKNWLHISGKNSMAFRIIYGNIHPFSHILLFFAILIIKHMYTQ